VPNIFSRPDKLNDAETILCEIDMVRFAARELTSGKPKPEKITWVLLEGFLLHFRNLIEFLGKELNLVKATDLHVTNLWGKTLPAELATIHAEGAKLWAKYERVDDRISRYLAHCTKQRTQVKQWEVGTMYGELEPLVAQIEAALPSRHWPAETPVFILGPASNSTASVSIMSPAVLDGSDPTKVRPVSSS